ncbi:MAG TPA: hypothetical protein VKE40_25600 [Gemmataceae bacterium]|nr:hypothetical protein [Gemmataceae bacterium]
MKPPWYERWWVFLACGLSMTFGSAYVYRYLADWEANPDAGELSMHWLAALIYRLGGKWLLSALVLAVGFILTVTGLRRRRVQTQRGRSADQPVA